jgi:hypothetical protein
MIDRKFLDDKENYSDDLEIPVGENMKVRLGDLRAYDVEQRTNLDKYTARSSQLENAYGQLANQYNEHRRLYDQVAQQLQGLQQNPTPNRGQDFIEQLRQRLGEDRTPTVMEKPGDFFQPLIEKLKEIDQIAAQNKRFQEDLRRELTGAFGFQVSKDMKRDYRSFDWPKDWTFNKVIELAKERNILEPGSQYPDFDRIHEAVTAPINAAKEREEIVKTAREEGYAQARKEMYSDNGAIVPTPGFGGGMATAQLKSKFGGIEKIPDETILNDMDVWNQMVQ